MAKRKDQRQEAFEAGERNLIPGQAWVAALARGLQRELSGSDMGTPLGQAMREELGSLGYEQMLREQYPEEFARGRMATSEFLGPEVITPGLMRAGIRPRFPMTGEVLPPSGRPVPMGPGGRGGPTIEGRATGPGVAGPESLPMVADARPTGRLPGEMRGPVDIGTSYRPMSPFERNTANLAMQRFGVYQPEMAVTDMQRYAGPVGPRSAGMAAQPSGFERNMVAATQMRGGPRPQGYGQFGATPYPSYFEEGGQGFRPTIDDYVDVNVVKNPERYYSENAENFIVEQMRAGNKGIWRHPYYGDVRASRPPYGEVPEGYVSPIERMPRPGIQRRPQPEGRAPYGEGAPGRGYFGELPRPGIQRRPEGGAMVPQGERGMTVPGAGVPGLRYEPVGQMPGAPIGRGIVPTEIAGEFSESPAIGYGGGRGLVPTEIAGEFREVPGIAGGMRSLPPEMRGPAGYGVPPVGPAGSPMMARGAAGGPSGPYMPAVAAAGGLGFGFGAGMMGSEGDRRRVLPPMVIPGREGEAFSALNNPLAQEYAGRELMGWNPSVGRMEDQNFQATPQAKPRGAAGKKAKATRGTAKEVPLPPTRPAELDQSQFDPNFNYRVMELLDRLTGQGEAERGRQYQQAVEDYQRKYGQIYY